MASIPYVSSLALGSIVADDILKNVENLGKLEKEVQDRQDELNSLIETRRSLDLTLQELRGLNIQPGEDFQKEVDELNGEIVTSTLSLAQTRKAKKKEIVKLRIDIANGKVNTTTEGGGPNAGANAGSMVSDQVESPLDYSRTQFKKMPLSADSLKMNAQYFSKEQNEQGAENHTAQVKSFVSSELRFLGTARAMEAAASAQSQTSSQHEKHELVGTLVITATCTHKNALIMEPFILDPDKAVSSYNAQVEKLGKKDHFLDPESREGIEDVLKDDKSDEAPKLRLISGATYGSSFVGLVHVLKSEQTDTSQRMEAAAASMQATMKAGSWFASMKGGFGVDSSFANDVKRLLSSQQVFSHISVICMGLIPSVKSNQVMLAVKEFKEFDPKAMGDKLAALHNSTTADKDSVNQNAEAARTGAQMVELRSSEIKSVLSAVGERDAESNKMLDINSLMTAFEEYVDKAGSGEIGVPVNYMLKTVTKKDIAKLWVKKYFGSFLDKPAEDEEETPPPAPPAN